MDLPIQLIEEPKPVEKNGPTEENFNSGAFVLSRSLFSSGIWFMSPEYIKIWIYLIGKANHKGKKYKGYFCERGQYFCDYQELLDQLKYKIGYRKKTYNESFMKNLMKFLRKAGMINTMKKPRGILVTLINYSPYQALNNYEKTNEKTNEKTIDKPHENQRALSINKNGQELNNKTFILMAFEKFYTVYPKRQNRKDAEKAWNQLWTDKKSDYYSGPLDENKLNLILAAVEKQTKSENWQKDGGTFIPLPASWLRGNRWEDEVQNQPSRPMEVVL